MRFFNLCSARVTFFVSPQMCALFHLQMMREDRDLFSGADTDSDGSLNEQEFLAFRYIFSLKKLT